MMIYEILFDFFQLFHCFIIILILFMKNWLENHKHFFIFCYQLHLILYLESLLMDSIFIWFSLDDLKSNHRFKN